MPGQNISLQALIDIILFICLSVIEEQLALGEYPSIKSMGITKVITPWPVEMIVFGGDALQASPPYLEFSTFWLREH